jgi:Ni/Co efflux regulator RcnB
MRIVTVILLFAAVGIPAASAQQKSAQPQGSWSMDHGHAADAAAAARQDAALARAKEAAIAAGLPLLPSQSTNFSVNGDSIIAAGPALTPEQQQAEAEARAAWQTRCRPTVVEDREGMRRTRYAEPDCDLSRFNTAGQ